MSNNSMVPELAKLLDPQHIYQLYTRQYKRLYNSRNETQLLGYHQALAVAEKITRGIPEFYSDLCAIKRDAFTSDRELAALGFAIVEAAITV